MMAGNKAAQWAYTKPLIESYLSKGLFDIGPEGRLMLGRIGGPTGAPLANNYLGVE